MALSGKVAFITGGARGLGKAFAEVLLQRGAMVSLADINHEVGKRTEKDFQSRFGEKRAIFNRCDVTSLSDLRACYKQTIEKFGGLDVVINNAGIMDEEDFERMIDINLTAIIRSSFMAASFMSKQQGGRGGIIINVASASGLLPAPFLLAYTAAKHGVVGFSRAMALNVKDKGKTGIKVAVLCPTFAETDMIMQPDTFKVKESRPDDVTMPNREQAVEQIKAIINDMGVMKVDKVADGLLELLSEENCNGAVLRITPLGTKYVYPKRLANKL